MISIIKTNLSLDKVFLFFLCFFPFSLIIGSAFINISIFLIIFFGIFFFLYKKIDIRVINNKCFFYLLVFFIYLIFSSFFSKDIIFSIYKSFGYLRFYFILVFYVIFFNYKPEYIKYFFFVLLLLVFVVSIDALIQFFYKQNFLGGHEYTAKKGYIRLTGVFKDEQIVGGFLLKILFLSLYAFFYFKNRFIRKYTFHLNLFIIILTCSAIFLSGERAAYVVLIIALLVYIIFNYKLRELLQISIIFILFFSIIFSNNNFQTRFKQIFHGDLGIGKTFNIKDTIWGAHYLTSLKIFKDNILTGSGVRTFRFECKNFKVDSKSNNQRCSTHSHNLFLEVLSETGVIGVFLFLFFLYYFFKIYKFYAFNNFLTLKISVLVNIFSFFVPFFPSGSFFSTFNAALIWLSFIAFFIAFNYKQKNN